MKKFTSKFTEDDYKICGNDTNSPLAISRAITTTVFKKEELHWHDNYEFYIFIKGKAEMEIAGEIIPVAAGNTILVEAGEKHKVCAIFEEIDYITIKDVATQRFVKED